ncbi:MAG: LysR family transcriptional regulator, partial [Intestinibaculum porci]|uniref:LysR family transcriptional regulator n=1 Tax=Intestinibaculum porci TaxID=2487118 RepID=UPI002409D538
MLDFRIQTFLTVCQTMNFTEAAKQLHMTQPAVSQHIHFLEKEYQATLFVYQNKRLSLTPAGTLLYKRLLTMQNDEKSIKEELKTLNTTIETLSLGVTMTVGEYAIVEKLAHYLKKHPQTNIHIHYGN